MNIAEIILPLIPYFILAVVGLFTVIFLVLFIQKYKVSQKNIGTAIAGLESKLGNHNGRSPRELDAVFAK